MTLQHSRTLRLFGWLLDIGAVCWLCLYPLFATVSVFVLFLLVGQGRELLYILVEPKYDGWQQPQRLVVYMAFAALAVAVWHTSRVLLAVRYHGLGTQSRTNADSAEMAHLRAEFPRTLAFVVLTIPSVAWLAGGHYRPAIVALLIELVVMYVLNDRETALSGHALTLRGTPLLRMERVPKRTKWIVAAWLLYALVLVQAIVNFPVVVPRVLGAASIVLMAFTGWTIFGGFVLTLWPKSYGLPSMAVAVPLLLVLISMWTNDNHAPRTYDGPVLARVPRTDAEATFDAWLHARRLPAASAYPVFIVATEGGGLRAAYWTATVLGYLQDHWPGDDHFSDHVFAISGVSGGSLGAAVFASLIARGGADDAVVASCRGGYERAARCVLAEDFLAPTLAFLLFPDAIQRFWPWPFASSDRARALELAWETSWRNTMGSDALAAPFLDLWSGANGARRDVPSLLFNGTVVEDGRRFIVSNMVIGDSEFPDAYDAFDPSAFLFDADGRQLPGPQPKHGVAPELALSTAAHHSARFTFVSPAARIDRQDGAGVWGRVVDGGYHENSGAQTTNDLLTSIAPAVGRQGAAIHVYAILISNAPDQPQLCDDRAKPAPGAWLPELTSPLDALLNAREARGSLARRIFARNLGERCTDRARIKIPGRSVFEFHILSKSARPTLGWFLSRAANAQMADALHRGENAATAAAVAGLAIRGTDRSRAVEVAPAGG